MRCVTIIVPANNQIRPDGSSGDQRGPLEAAAKGGCNAFGGLALWALSWTNITCQPITMWNITLSLVLCLVPWQIVCTLYVFVYSQPPHLLWICVRPIGEKCRPICKVQPTNGNREPEVVSGRHNRQYLLQMIFLSIDSGFLCHSVIVIVGWFLIFGLGHIVPHPAVIIVTPKRMWECVADQLRRALSNRQSGAAGPVADYCGRFSWGT